MCCIYLIMYFDDIRIGFKMFFHITSPFFKRDLFYFFSVKFARMTTLRKYEDL